MKYITLLYEKSKMESLGLFLHALLGEEEVINKVLEQSQNLNSSMAQTIEKMNLFQNEKSVDNKTDILKYFKWSISEGKYLESLRISLKLQD
jgi:hypothetical protein